jgi:phosphate-selective porin O/P
MPRHAVVPWCLAAVLAVPRVAAQTPAPEPAASPQPAAAPTFKLSGYLQAREMWQEDVGLTGSINRARLAASGIAARSVTYRLQGEFRTGSVGSGKASVSLQDAYIRFSRESWGLQVGQFKTPFTREFITSLADLETADRATVVDSLAPKRDIGFMGEYGIAKVATVYAGVFNGEGQNVTANRDSTMLGVGRVVVRPVPHVSLGVNAARYFADSTRYGADANYEDERIAVRGEYVGQAHDGVSAPDDHGWYVLGAYVARPEVQLVAKYETFERPAASDQQKSRAWTAGANFFPFGRATRLTFEYISRKVGHPGRRTGQLLSQAQVKF